MDARDNQEPLPDVNVMANQLGKQFTNRGARFGLRTQAEQTRWIAHILAIVLQTERTRADEYRRERDALVAKLSAIVQLVGVELPARIVHDYDEICHALDAVLKKQANKEANER